MNAPHGMQVRFAHNSLGLIRLAAAAQVAMLHVIGHIPGTRAAMHDVWISFFFPGVPIFFFISGFVISGAWRRDSHILRFALSRSIRILPALYAAFVFSLICIVVLYPPATSGHLRDLIAWCAAQMMMVYNWNPAFLRGYGTGTVNGSLWTIPVELSFYVAAPLLYALGKALRSRTAVLLAVLAASLVINAYAHYAMPKDTAETRLLHALLIGSPLSSMTWIWMFCLGCLAQEWFDQIIRPLMRFLPLSIVVFAATCYLARVHSLEIPALFRAYATNMGLINMLALAAVILGVAYRFPDLDRKLLRGNDFSYAIYLYHMPVLNALMMLGFRNWELARLTFAATAAMAALSWYALEKPMLGVGKKLRERLGDRPRPAPPLPPAEALAEQAH